MPHTITHCRTAGAPKGERSIKIYEGDVMNYAVHLQPHNMIPYGVSEREMEAFEKFFAANQAALFAEFERLGVPYTVHLPHKENLP